MLELGIDQVKNVVQTAAVLGREFELRLLLQMLKRDVKSEVTMAEQEQVWTILNALQYIFKHILLREASSTCAVWRPKRWNADS